MNIHFKIKTMWILLLAIVPVLSFSANIYDKSTEYVNGTEIETYYTERPPQPEFPMNWSSCNYSDSSCAKKTDCGSTCQKKKDCGSCVKKSKSCGKKCKSKYKIDESYGNSDASYRLKIGDQLYVSLYGYGEGNTARLVTVDPTGNIVYLFSGSVYALGKTIDEYRYDLQEKIREQFPNIIVAVSATQLVGDQYTIMGEVNQPGTRQLHGYSTVLSAIGEAGGFPIRQFRNHTIDYANLDRAFLARKGEYIPIDLDRLIRKGDISQNVRLQSGDYIYIPSIESNRVYVLGEVNTPIIYDYLKTATLTEAISWANDVTQYASPKVIVIRGSLACPTRFLINFDRIRKGCDRDFCLKPGDIVYVPSEPFRSMHEIFNSALRTFFAALAIEAGNKGYESIHPHAIGDVNNSSFINPGTIITLP